MNRTEFTFNVANLLLDMFKVGEQPILDYCKRSKEEQKRLFDGGLSKCDGEVHISAHQKGLAVDIYFVENGKLADPKKGWDYWHDAWCLLGGKPVIEWDRGHFE